MAVKSKITFVVPKNLQKELREHVIRDGYGLRGKSKWVSEAIERLFDITNFPELVNYSDEMSKFEKAETIVIEYPLKQKLENAIISVRRKFPILEGVKSRIVRTAIIQRFLRGQLQSL